MVQSYRKMLETGNIFWLCSVFFVKQFFCQTIKDNFWGSHSAWNLLGVFSRELCGSLESLESLESVFLSYNYKQLFF